MGDGILKEDDLHELYRGYICFFGVVLGIIFIFIFLAHPSLGKWRGVSKVQ
jgi:hypothetical protein